MAKESFCPGCSRHCPLDRVRCRHGEKYMEKKMKKNKQSGLPECAQTKKQRKWEKYVRRGETAWILLDACRRIKRSLRKKRITEQQLSLALTPDEQAQLRALLSRLAAAADE